MTTARSHFVTPGSDGCYHCVQRCVRRAFRCGVDSYTGQSFEHRKAWVEERLHHLGSCFAIAIHAYAVMSNHLHVVIQIDTAVLSAWSDDEVAARWLQLFPPADAEGAAVELKRQCLLADTARLDVIRRRLKIRTPTVRNLPKISSRHPDHAAIGTAHGDVSLFFAEPHRLKIDMPKDRPRVRPSPVEIGGWIVDGLIVLALCIATAKGHRVAFGFFALFAIVGLATRAHWTAAYVIPNGLRVLTALLYLSSGILLTAAAFDLLSGTATTAARWTFTVACAITLAARMAAWRAAALPTDTTA